MSDFTIFCLVFMVVLLIDAMWKSRLQAKIRIEEEKTKQIRLQNDVNLDDLK